MKIHDVFHVSLLEPYHQPAFPQRHQPPPPPVIVDSTELYEVEEILDSKRTRNQLQYLVKWKGYPISENSWHPAGNLKEAPDAVAHFHRRYPTKPGPKSKSKSKPGVATLIAFSA
jgi:hypothetical protein